MLELNRNYNMDCIDGIRHLDDNCIDLMCTSPPYNVGVDYDIYDDNLSCNYYYIFIQSWFKELYRVMKIGGRLAINVPYEVNMKERGGRKFIVADYYNMMVNTGFKYNCTIQLREIAPHRVKNTAWGSWASPSAPYIYNPLECILVGYKEQWKKVNTGESYFNNDETKKEFRNLVSGIWDYRAETRGLTKANFSLDLPMRAIKIFTYKDDVVLDPFSGSGTTLCAAKILNRRYIGFEVSHDYWEIANNRLVECV